MSSASQVITNEFLCLIEKWNRLESSEPVEQQDFNKLYEQTLHLILDVRIAANPALVENSVLNKFMKTLTNIRLPSDMLETIASLGNVEQWEKPMASALLSGKLITRAIKHNQQFEQKLLAEDDVVIRARIDSLMQMFRQCDTNESSQMIFNSIDTYKKFLICEPELQNKISCQTMESLVKSLLIMSCHRKEYDHLNSMIKFLPRHRKLKFILNEITQVLSTGYSKKQHNYELFITVAIAQELLQSEFMKPFEQQNISMLSLYINLMIDLAVKEKFIERQLEKLILSASEMNVISDYYYLVANLLRLKMPNRFETLVVKLISIGLSHDLTHLEQIKYTKEGAAMKWTETDFIATCRKMYQALITLGFIINDYSLRRLCIQAASVCEPSTDSCKAILSELLEAESGKCETSFEMKTVFRHLREQLELFQSAIKMNISLPTTWQKSSIQCYKQFEYLNRRVELSEDLKHLEYPGIERHLKKLKVDTPEESEEVEKKPLDANQILRDSTEFAKIVSSRLKQIKNPFKVHNDVKPPLSQVIAVIFTVLRNSPDFEFNNFGHIFMKLSKETSLEALNSYRSTIDLIHNEQRKLNKPNLFFDFDMTEKDASEREFTSMYQEGTVRVHDLCVKGYNIFDIENVMLYTIMEKKMKFIQSEFTDFNKNQAAQETENQAQHAFNYLLCCPQPQHSRIKKIVYIARSASMLDYNLEYYTFEAIPGRYKYVRKNQLDSNLKDDVEVDQSMEIPTEESSQLSTTLSIKKPTRKSPKVPKITPQKEAKKDPSINSELIVSQPNAKTEIISLSHVKPIKKVEVVTLDSEETFHASEDLLTIFLLLQNELSIIVGEKVTLNLMQMCDESSPHKVDFLLKSTDVKAAEIKVQKRRNQRIGMTMRKEISLPIHNVCAIVIHQDFTDEIVYDEYVDNPQIKSTLQIKLSGGLLLENTSHNIKNMIVNCCINGIDSKIKLTMKNEHRRQAKRPLKVDATNGTGKEENGSETKLNNLMFNDESANAIAMFNFSSPPENFELDSKLSTNVLNNEIPPTQFIETPLICREPVSISNPQYQFYDDYSTTNLPQSPPTEVNNFSPFVKSYNFNNNHENRESLTISCPSNNSKVTKYTQQIQTKNNVKLEAIISYPVIAEASYGFLPAEVKMKPPNYVPPQTQLNLSDTLTGTNQISSSLPAATIQNNEETQVLKVEEYSRKKMCVDPIALNFMMGIAENNDCSDYNVPVSLIKNQPVEVKERPRIEIIEADYFSEAAQNGCVKSSADEKLIDFDDVLPSTQVIRSLPVSVIRSCVQEQTPPASPPPLHYRKETSSAQQKEKVVQDGFEASAYRIVNSTPPDEVIDLTQDVEISTNTTKRTKPRIGPASRMQQRPGPASRKTVNPDNICFVSCESSNGNRSLNMLTTAVEPEPNDMKKKFSSVMKKQEAKKMKFVVNSNGTKRFRTTTGYGSGVSTCRETEIHLVNVLNNMDLSVLHKDIYVEANLVQPKMPVNFEPYCPNRRDYQLKLLNLEQPIEDYVTDVRESTFHIQNIVSYSINQSGDGFANTLLTANNQCNEDISRKPNLLKKSLNNASVNNSEVLKMSNSIYVDNIANNKIMGNYANVDLFKTFYSDKNKKNFTKNLKNSKKFCHWTPKVNNDYFDNDDFIDKLDKKVDNDKDLLYQMSHDIFDSIPGLNSFEFFQFPSTPRRMVHVKVIHVYKDMKNGSSSTSCDNSDTDGEQHSETNNLQSDNFNGESSHASSTHVQRIGQTSINRESDPKTIQTSFGSIIKNTYPPATLSNRSGANEIIKTIEKDQQKYAKLKNEEVQIKKITNHHDLSAINKVNSNIKIVACGSSSSQVEAPKHNRNQTLINMLTQQVMLPTNSNRHFIITSNKADMTKTDNNITTVTSSLPSHQNVLKKVVTSTGQSQLVQILNSPPSSFTMKSLNTSVATSQSKPLNQVVTVASTTANNTFKAELPTAVKQQGIVQFICKTDGKIIHLTPICNNSAGGSSKKITYKVDTTGAKGPTILHHANQQIIINNPLKKSDNQNILTIIQKQDDGEKKNKSPMLTVSQSSSTPVSPISTRSMFEETYAKFIQTSSTSKSSDMGLLTISSSPINTPITSSTQSSIIQKIGKTVIQQSGQALPKFNHAFGKTVFTTNATINDQMKNKIVCSKETLTSRQTAVSFTETKPITKLTRTVAEIKSTDAGTLLSLIENDNTDKQLPTLQTALQNSLLYARPIGNGKLLASNSNNVLLTALRGNNQTSNVRIITSVPENVTRSSGALMAPMRISVPIQIPKLINTSVRPQTAGNFRQQIVIATAPTRIQQATVNSQQTGSKLESLLMTSQPAVVKQEVEVEQHQVKIEPKQKKNVDHSTLEQLREFDMVLEQVLERSSSEVTATSMSSPPTPESVNNSTPSKQGMSETKFKTEIKLNSVTITSISPSVSPSPKVTSCGSNVVKAAPKLQEDEHTAQRILDILANYKEQVRNSPDLNNKPAPRRRANPPTNPPVAKRKKIIVSGNMKTSSKFGSTSDMMTDTMGSEEDSSCGMGSGVASTGSMNNSPQPNDIDDVSMDNNFYMEDLKRETALSPQSSNSSVATSPSHNKFSISRRLILTETKVSPGNEMNQSPSKNIVITSTQPSPSGGAIERNMTGQGSTAVLMPGNYLLPMNVLKGGQQLAILSSNNGQKIIAVPTNQLVGNSSGTSIILQRYLNQANEAGNKTGVSNDTSQNAFKSVRLQQSPSIAYVNNKINSSGPSANTLYIRPIQNMSNNLNDNKTIISNQPTLIKQDDDATSDSQNSKFVSDKTLITEIIQQQQQLSHTHQHPQQNFMIKLNEHQPSDPRSSSSIMFVSNTNSTTSSFVENTEISVENPKIKIEEMDYDEYMKEDAIDLLSESEAMAKSPMLNTKIEVDENTNSNHETNNLIYDNSVVKMEAEQERKFQHFPIILNSCHGKTLGVNHITNSRNIKGFLIDPSNKIVMYNDRKPATIEKEFFNQKSFSEECADLGVDEPIASDLFPEADLLFDSGSPKFDQINSHDGAMHIKKELENGQVLLEMNYNHNMETESWLNFDTEEELVDGSQINDGGGGDGHSGDLKAYF